MTTQADHSCIDDYMKYASIPIQNIRLDGKNELISILQSLRGRKCLILDNQLGSLFNNIISFDDTVSGNGSKFLRVSL